MKQGLLFEVKTDTLKAARRDVMESRPMGLDCPCCGLYVKQYRRKIHAGMAAALIVFYKYQSKDYNRDPEGYSHVNELMSEKYPKMVRNSGRQDFPKLRYWGLIEEKWHDQEEETKRKSGRWRMTAQGINFASGFTTVKRYAIIFNSELLKIEGPRGDIQEALGDHFKYQELMGI